MNVKIIYNKPYHNYKDLGLIPVIPVYQIRIDILCDDILWMCTKIYKNNSDSLIPDFIIINL